MKKREKSMMSLLANTAAVTVAGVWFCGGCASIASSKENSQSPLMETKTFNISGTKIIGVKLLKVSMGTSKRASRGHFKTGHFD